MGFFSDLKEDLSQAVNELMPEELTEQTPAEETKVENALAEVEAQQAAEAAVEDGTEEFSADISLEEMLKNIEDIQIPDDMEFAEIDNVDDTAADVSESEESWIYQEPVEEFVEAVVEVPAAEEPAIAAMPVVQEIPEQNSISEENEDKGADVKMDSYVSRQATDETAVITAGMKIKGDITSEGSVDVVGTVEGNLDVWGKLNVTGHINGNSQAAEIYAEGAKITGEIVSAGAVKIGNSSVIIGNITAKSAAIAGAVKGDIDVQGPVVLDSSAIVMGNIKSKSVQINNGAVIEGMCSQCYADVSPLSFFDEYKTEFKNSKKNK